MQALDDEATLEVEFSAEYDDFRKLRAEIQRHLAAEEADEPEPPTAPIEEDL